MSTCSDGKMRRLGWVFIERILIPEVGGAERLVGHTDTGPRERSAPIAGVKSLLTNVVPENLHISSFSLDVLTAQS